MVDKTPKIRFKDYTSSWEQRKLSEFVDKAVDNRGKTPPLDENGTHPLIEVSALGGVHPDYSKVEKYLNDNSFENNLRAYIKEGDILFTTVGSIGLVSLMDSREEAAIAQNIVAFRAKENFVPEYLYALFSNEENQYKAKRIVMGAVQPSIKVSQLVDVEYMLTENVKEQKKIGAFFSNLDNLITLHQREYDRVSTLKKAMLKKMFPKNGETKPEIRFSGFTDDWEQRKFGDLAEYKKGPFGSAITKDMFVPKSDESIKVYEQQNAINKDWSLERYFLPKSYALTKLKSFEVHGGDIIVSCAGTIGEIYEIPENADSGVINQALMRVRVNDTIVDKKMFIIAFSNMIDAFTRTHSNGSAIKNIPPFSDLKPMEVLMPSMDEQRKISGYFTNLDNLITLQQRKLEKLKCIKKSLLENMFV